MVPRGMGVSGKKLQGHGQRRKTTSPAVSVGDGGYGNPPHPAHVRAGQKYWPLAGRRRRAFTIRSVAADGLVRARRVDGKHEQITTTAERILATLPDGQGRHYSFLAWTPRRYRTWAVVMEFAEEYSTLVLPEWHPGRPVSFPSRLLPTEVAGAGAWLTLQVDLSVAAGGQLNPSDLACCEYPGAACCTSPTWAPTA